MSAWIRSETWSAVAELGGLICGPQVTAVHPAITGIGRAPGPLCGS